MKGNGLMDISRLRQKVFHLDARRRRLQGVLLNPRKMMVGSLYEVYKKCGNPRCKCARGERHGPFKYLSLNIRGKTKMVFVRKEDIPRVTERARNYKSYQTSMAEIRKINEEIFQILKQIRNSNIEKYP